MRFSFNLLLLVCCCKIVFGFLHLFFFLFFLNFVVQCGVFAESIFCGSLLTRELMNSADSVTLCLSSRGGFFCCGLFLFFFFFFFLGSREEADLCRAPPKAALQSPKASLNFHSLITWCRRIRVLQSFMSPLLNARPGKSI